jgi:hypothetical protein
MTLSLALPVALFLRVSSEGREARRSPSTSTRPPQFRGRHESASLVKNSCRAVSLGPQAKITDRGGAVRSFGHSGNPESSCADPNFWGGRPKVRNAPEPLQVLPAPPSMSPQLADDAPSSQEPPQRAGSEPNEPRAVQSVSRPGMRPSRALQPRKMTAPRELARGD